MYMYVHLYVSFFLIIMCTILPQSSYTDMVRGKVLAILCWYKMKV